MNTKTPAITHPLQKKVLISLTGLVIFLFLVSSLSTAQEIPMEEKARLKEELKAELKGELKKEILEEIQAQYALVPKNEMGTQAYTPVPPGPNQPAGTAIEEPPPEKLFSYELGKGLRVAGERLTLRGFSDVTFEAKNIHERHGPHRNENFFAIGQYDLFITSKLNDSISFLGETVFETEEDRGVVVDVERLLVRYALKDFLNISLGRYHTPLGYWTPAYAHGRWLHTPVFRPELFRWEDEEGVLPLHQVGVLADGKLNLGMWELGYAFGLSNGRGRTREEVQNTRDLNNDKAVSLRLSVSNERVPGLTAGWSFYRDEIPKSSVSPVHRRMDELIYGPYITYLRGNYEILAEALNIHHHDDRTGDNFNTLGSYVQLARRWGKFKPYYRLDRINFNKSDPFFGPNPNSILKNTLGLRYDVSTFNALKFELSHSDTSEGNINAIAFQSAFAF